jgi:hypothetical protein
MNIFKQLKGGFNNMARKLVNTDAPEEEDEETDFRPVSMRAVEEPKATPQTQAQPQNGNVQLVSLEFLNSAKLDQIISEQAKLNELIREGFKKVGVKFD